MPHKALRGWAAAWLEYSEFGKDNRARLYEANRTDTREQARTAKWIALQDRHRVQHVHLYALPDRETRKVLILRAITKPLGDSTGAARAPGSALGFV
jgi:hypothetical protein